MNILSDHQIKQYQLSLLQKEGPSLSNYTSDLQQQSRHSRSRMTQFQMNKINVIKYKSMGFTSNANIKAFTFILLQIIYGQQINQDILSIIKSTLYDSQINISSIKHNPFPQLTNQQAKKLLVQFFYSLTYSNQKNKIQSKFNKYPIVINIFIVCIRAVLAKFNVKYANNYLFKIPTGQVIDIMKDFFDLNCRSIKSLYLFYQDNLFLLETENDEIILGNYTQNQTDNHYTARLETWQNQSSISNENLMQFNRQTQFQVKRQSTQSDNFKYQLQKKDVYRSNLQNLISNNNQVEVQIQQDAPTPFFSSQIPQLNFKNLFRTSKDSKEITPITSKRHKSFGIQFEAIQQNFLIENQTQKRHETHLSQISQIQKNQKKHQKFFMNKTDRQSNIKSLKRSRSQSSLQKISKQKQNPMTEQKSRNLNKDDTQSQKIHRSYVQDNKSEILHRQSFYQNKAKNNSEDNLLKKKIIKNQKISNIYSINISNIANEQNSGNLVNNQKNMNFDDLQRKKSSSLYYIRPKIVFNKSNIPQTSIKFMNTVNNNLYTQRYNNPQKHIDQKVNKFQQRPVYMFRKNKDINNKVIKNHNKVNRFTNNYHTQDKVINDGLLQCSLSPISHIQIQFSSLKDKNIINKAEVISFTSVNQMRGRQFLKNKK